MKIKIIKAMYHFIWVNILFDFRRKNNRVSREKVLEDIKKLTKVGDEGAMFSYALFTGLIDEDGNKIKQFDNDGYTL
jgi:hypothetical protein